MSDTPKKTLESIQQWMQQTLLQHEEGGDVHEFIQDSSRLSAEKHLEIYQRSYVARLRECMAKQFPALEFALGKELFVGFADEYLKTYPSRSYTLMDLGSQFEDYLQETRPDRESPEREDWPDFLIELSRFEYLINLSFDEEAPESKEPATESTPVEALALIPVFHLQEFRFPVPQYYNAFKKDMQPSLPFEQASWSVILRVNHQLAIQGLNYWQYQLLCLLKEGRTVSEALHSIQTESGHPVAEVEGAWEVWRSAWISAGFFSVKA